MKTDQVDSRAAKGIVSGSKSDLQSTGQQQVPIENPAPQSSKDQANDTRARDSETIVNQAPIADVVVTDQLTYHNPNFPREDLADIIEQKEKAKQERLKARMEKEKAKQVKLKQTTASPSKLN